MNDREEQMGEVIVTMNSKKQVQALPLLHLRLFENSWRCWIENILKTLPGVNSNNELSTQYAVRGGNYDENLVYVNEIEPFLIRSGQQEGLSFTNTDLVQNVEFSGGFQAKFEIILYWILPIETCTFGRSEFSWRKPVSRCSFEKIKVDCNYIRYRNNSLLVNSQDTQTNFTPAFVDVQTNVNYQASPKWQWSFLGTYHKINTNTNLNARN
jgi:hypothetical protein